MRKLLAIFLIVVAIALAAVLLVRRPVVEIEALEVIPSDAIAVLEIKHPVKTWRAVRASDLGRDLAAAAVWKELGVRQWFEDLARRIETAGGGMMNEKTWEDILGRGLVVTLIPPVTEGGSPALLAVTRPGLRSRALESLARLLDGLKKETKRLMSVDDYSGYRLVSFDPSPSFPFFIAYSLGGDFLAVIVSQDLPQPFLRRIIDLRREPGTVASFSRAARYLEIHRTLDAAETDWLEFFIDFDNLNEAVRSLAGFIKLTGPDRVVVEWNDLIQYHRRYWRTLRAAGAKLLWEEGAAARLAVAVDPLPAGADRLILEEEDSPRSSALVPAGPLVYFVQRRDLLQVWKEWREAHGILFPSLEEETPGSFGWEEESGLFLERDLLPFLGREAAFLLGDFDFDGLLPLPDVSILAAVNDKERVRAVLDKFVVYLVSSRGLNPPARIAYQGVEITFFPVPLLAQPAYAFVGDFLVISSSRETLTRMIDTMRGELPRLDSTALFRKLAGRVIPAGDTFAYLDTKNLIDRAIKLVDWWKGFSRSPAGPLEEGNEWGGLIISSLEIFRRFEGLALNRRWFKNIYLCDFYWYIEKSISED